MLIGCPCLLLNFRHAFYSRTRKLQLEGADKLACKEKRLPLEVRVCGKRRGRRKREWTSAERQQMRCSKKRMLLRQR
jgi:hypothetical protein